ncbi:glycoside hydrolase family 1 protein [Pectobacterium punjabense]|uniref:glycoside hydrolase family 1 protein n=1 Tax=Pectobacterium punjabense TaxID=2108399 RepID=UPI0037F96826
MFPNNFLWGSATASYQAEGAYNQDNRGMTIWDEFTHTPGKSFGDSNGDVAADHYHRIDEDIRLMKETGHNAYRFSIAWSRILPQGIGDVNQCGLKYYNELIDKLIKNNIEPMVTLYHWDLPLALGNNGSWENRDTIDAFIKYAKICYKAFGDRVRIWTTFNEPTYFIKSGYLIGNYPPQVQDFRRAAIVFHNVMVASALAIRAFREMNVPGEIGVVHAYETIYPASDKAEDIQAAKFADDIYNNIVYDVTINGIYPPALTALLSQHMDLAFIEQDAAILKGSTVDYLGVNYYSRYVVEHYSGTQTILKENNSGSIEDKGQVCIAGLFRIVDVEDAEYNDWDTEIFPQGLTDALLILKKKYNIPVYITENGIGLRETPATDGSINDDVRVRYIREHVKAIEKAIELGVDVRGYFHWSTMDLYSWVNGYDKRYGLFYVDFSNGCQRTLKQSAYAFRDIALSNGTCLN